MAKQPQGQDLGGGLFAQVDPRGRVVLSGGITEAASFKPLLSRGNPLELDLERVDRINSLGVRHWCHFIRDAENAGLSVTVDRVSAVMIQQLGMISNFMGNRTKVRSLFVPYLCPSCNSDDLQLVEVGADGAVNPPDSISCKKCKSPMQIDELPEMYETLREILAGR